MVTVETSAECNLKCVMCPTLLYDKEYKGYMHRKTFDEVIKYLKKDIVVVLTGWGEPLLDRKLFNRLRICKDIGCTVYIASNGFILNMGKSIQLLELGLDGITISVDGSKKFLYEKIRVNSKFERVIENINHLSYLKNKINKNFIIDTTFVVTKTNYLDILDFVIIMAENGVDSITISPMHVFSKENIDDKVNEEDLFEILSQAKNICNVFGITLRTFILKNDRLSNNCLANAVNNVFISFKGDVSPCCNIGHPVLMYSGNKNDLEPNNLFTVFGNITKENLITIWYKPEYTQFRETLKKGLIPSQCRYCDYAPDKKI